MNLPFDFLKLMAHDPVRNYIAPGLTSSLIGKGDKGCVRLFESSRDQQFAVTPHSHRFDFFCVVIKGSVRNRLWQLATRAGGGDPFVVTTLEFDSMGKYAPISERTAHFTHQDKVHLRGESYQMKAPDIHSIYFGADTAVLFFEGPTVRNHSVILEPCVDGVKVPTFQVEPWMFKKERAAA